jgi:hypothetical protein
MRRFLVILLFFLIFSPAHAQFEWSSWLLTPDDGRMTLVNQNGFIEDFILPLPSGFDAYDFESMYNLNVAPNGSLFAYNVLNSATQARQLLVYNHELKGITATYDLTANGAETAPTPMFNHDSTELAIGYSLADGWEIILIDLVNFSIITDLRYDDLEAANLLIADPITPSISWYHRDELAFTLITSSMEADDVSKSYIWNTSDGTITESEVDALYPPTGERIAGVYNPSVPSNSQFVKMANTLRADNPNTGQSYTFYTDPGAWLLVPRFVANGAYIAFLRYHDNDDWRWMIIDREGNRVEEFPTSVSDVEGTGDGYLYIDANVIYYATLDSTEPSEVYTLSGDSYIMWVGSLSGVPLFTAQSYPAWGAGIASNEPDVVVVAEASPTPDNEGLREGIVAIVNTSNGDSLNMRTDAGTDFQIRKKLPRGTSVMVVEGPIERSGFSWWKVREPEGVEGWVVDYADGVLTLVPQSAFETGADTETAANPTMLSELEVGDAARVTLSSRNDALRLRNGAGLNFRIISLLPPGARVTVVDGPRLAENLTWWQIRTSEGNVGWAAEIIGSERALTRDDTVPRATIAPTTSAAATTTYVPPDVLIQPLLVSPLPQTVLTIDPRVVKLSWSPVPDARSYTLEIEGCSGSLESCTPLQSFPDLTATTYDLTIPIDGLFRWRVIATDGRRTSDSGWWSFEFNTN